MDPLLLNPMAFQFVPLHVVELCQLVCLLKPQCCDLFRLLYFLFSLSFLSFESNRRLAHLAHIVHLQGISSCQRGNLPTYVALIPRLMDNNYRGNRLYQREAAQPWLIMAAK